MSYFDQTSKEKTEARLSSLQPIKTFGLAVSGDVSLNMHEVKIVNSHQFQRLRKLKQLGSTYLVYPTATHTRFDHSIGVLSYAGQIVQAIRKNGRAKDQECKISYTEEHLVRLMALLHDIGHIPFGHTIEDEFKVFDSHDKHLARWEFFLGPSSDIGTIIEKGYGKEFHKLFFDLIKCEKNFVGLEEYAFAYDIVSNTVCADLLDYLRRDSQQTGLRLDFHPRFLNYMIIRTVKNKVGVNERRIVLRAHKGNKNARHDILTELTNILRSRYYLGERVYYHHTKIKTGCLISGAVQRANLANSFSFLDNSNSRKDIHQMGDDQLIEFLKNLRSPKKTPNENNNSRSKRSYIEACQRLVQNFESRLIFKEILNVNFDTLGISEEDLEFIQNGEVERAINPKAGAIYNTLISKNGSQNRIQFEKYIAELIPEIEDGDLLIYCPSYKMMSKLAKTKVEWVNGSVYELNEISHTKIKNECQLINRNHRALWSLRVFLHPKHSIRKDTKGKALYDLITKYIDAFISSIGIPQSSALGLREEFFKAYISFMLDHHFDEIEIPNASKEFDRKVNELATTLSSETQSEKGDGDVVKELIVSKFKSA